MATADPGSIIRVPGRLSHSCTSLTTAWPHGGTGLGLCDQIIIKPNRRVLPIRDEGYGAVVEGIDLGEEWMLMATLRGWDEDAVNKLFPATTVGSTSAKRGVYYPNAFRPGTKLSASAIKLVFTPDDEFNHRFLVIRSALPLTKSDTEIELESSAEHKISVVFWSTIDGTESFAWQFREDITL